MISIDSDAAGHGWFVDPTPLDNEEFVPTELPWEWKAKPGSEADGRIDLLTVMAHEMGHVIGLGDISQEVIPTHLMTGTLPPGIRRLPSLLDLAGFRQNTTTVFTPLVATTPWPNVQTAASNIQVPTQFLTTAQPDLVHTGILNGNFAVANANDPGFGWIENGSVAVTNGAAVLHEDDRVLTGLSQIFTVPEGASKLRFTLTGFQFGQNGDGPPDAFEVALLNATTMQSLAAIADLSRTDALLNVQSDGTAHVAPSVHITGLHSSGDRLALDSPLLAEIDLSGIQAGSIVRLYFDLLGFGPATSFVTIDHVRLVQAGENGQIQGTEFLDLNSDGIQQASEQAIAGSTIYLDANRNGQLDTDENYTVTGLSGTYSFTDLAAGNYRVAEVVQAGWVQTAPSSGTYDVTLASGETRTGLDFGSLRLTLDVDGNGRADALSDGILIIRHLFGFTGNALINDVVDPAGTRNTAKLVEDYLHLVGPVMLDVDGNGQADAPSDGIIIIRYLFGFTGDALITGVVDPLGTRHTAAAVEAFLNGFLPVASPSVQAQSFVTSAPLAASAPTTTTTTSAAPTPSVPLVVMESATAAAPTPTSVVATDTNVPTTDLSLAYVQRSWVKDYVNESVITNDEKVKDELVIQLQEPVLA